MSASAGATSPGTAARRSASAGATSPGTSACRCAIARCSAQWASLFVVVVFLKSSSHRAIKSWSPRASLARMHNISHEKIPQSFCGSDQLRCCTAVCSLQWLLRMTSQSCSSVLCCPRGFDGSKELLASRSSAARADLQ